VRRIAIAVSVGLMCQLASASEIFILTDPSGLAAEVEFTLVDPTTLEVRARNISTGVPAGFEAADQILTGISWDFGEPGFGPGDPGLTGGIVVIGPASTSLDFDTGTYGPGFDVSGEWGFGNMDGSGALLNFISANAAQATPFGGPNLDGPVNIDGPQGGMVADPLLIPLGGLGAIQDEVVATLTIDEPLGDLGFLSANAVRVEFGSDAAFIEVPEPRALGLFLIALLVGARYR
jgi:hypothetical protein